MILRLLTSVCHTSPISRSLKGYDLLNEPVLNELESHSVAEKALKICASSLQPGRYV